MIRLFTIALLILPCSGLFPVVALPAGIAQAQTAGAGDERGRVTGLPVPRFVSIRAGEVNVRAGPGRRYPVEWRFIRRNLPVIVVDEFDTWRRIRDADGEGGWVHQSMLSGRRTVLVTGTNPAGLLRRPEATARTLAKLEPGVIAQLARCEDGWCRVTAGGWSGWLPSGALWGVDDRLEN